MLPFNISLFHLIYITFVFSYVCFYLKPDIYVIVVYQAHPYHQERISNCKSLVEGQLVVSNQKKWKTFHCTPSYWPNRERHYKKASREARSLSKNLALSTHRHSLIYPLHIHSSRVVRSSKVYLNGLDSQIHRDWKALSTSCSSNI